MSTWGLIQIVVDIFLGLGLFVVAMRISRQPKDDPRLSRGLQLLQAKIAVIEDLSDRTEAQVHQMTALIDQKCREVQNKIELADRHVQLVRSAMERSLEVAKIFQDRIPHTEIIERQNTLKYLEAARLAHQGQSAEEIAQQIDLPKGELEFIAKVNRDQLMFSEEQLPEWARRNDVAFDFVPDAQSYAHDSLPAQSSYHQQVDAEIHSGAEVVLDAEENRRRAVAETVRRSQEANHQELLENLQQVQRELDERLGLEVAHRDYSSVFDVPKPPTESLARLGEEFRKVCNEVSGDPQVQFSANRFSFNELTPPQSNLGSQNEAPSSSVPAEYQGFGQDTQEMSFEEEATLAPLLSLSQTDIEAIQRSTAQVVQLHAVHPNTATESRAAVAAPEAHHFGHSPVQPTTMSNPRFPKASSAGPAPAPAAPARTSTRVTSVANKMSQSMNTKSAPVIRKVQFPKIQVP